MHVGSERGLQEQTIVSESGGFDWIDQASSEVSTWDLRRVDWSNPGDLLKTDLTVGTTTTTDQWPKDITLRLSKNNLHLTNQPTPENDRRPVGVDCLRI